MPRALVTGFEPFGGESVNASFEAVRRLPPRIGTLDISVVQLPTSFARAGAELLVQIKRLQPAVVLGVGEAGERTALNIERIAINVQDARIPDNDGAQPVDVPVIEGGPAAYFSALPVRAILVALTVAKLPAVISNSAGSFVCNHAFYTLMHYAAGAGTNMRAGFLHVPCWRVEGNTPMALTDIVHGISIALEVSAS